jgi:F0F1-type ATP synthase assembly protein I
MKWEGWVPVAISILVILLVAVIQRYSRTLAAITATMPLNIPLSLWIVSEAAGDDRAGVVSFMDGMLWGILPTVVFVVVAWLAVRAGWKPAPTIAAGYAAWAAAVAVFFGVRRWLGAG